MNRNYREKIIEWIEPKYFLKLKGKYENEDKSIFEKIGILKIISFFIINFIIMYYWSIHGVVFRIEMTFSLALITSVAISSIIIIFYYFIYTFLGYSSITLNNGFVFLSRSGKNLKQWKCQGIDSCKVLSGIYKNKKYNAIELRRNNKLIGVFFLSDKIGIDDVIMFFENNGVNCIKS